MLRADLPGVDQILIGQRRDRRELAGEGIEQILVLLLVAVDVLSQGRDELRDAADDAERDRRPKALDVVIVEVAGIAGAAETLLVDRACISTHLPVVVKDLLDAGCEVRGDAETQTIDPRVKPATEADWATEYLDAIIACRVVDGLDGALEHIARWSSNHTDCIVTDDKARAERFLNEVDSAIVLHNASTQFADGGEFGFGAEIGIATGRMHARGPVGVDQLTSFNYRVRGTGQTRA